MNDKVPVRTLESYAADTVRVLNEGRRVFGSIAEFEVWLNTPHRELGNESPAMLLSTEEGTELVMKELVRIGATSGSKSNS